MTTAAELIRQAYSLASVLDPNEEVEGFYATTGLSALNMIIAQWSSLQVYIPTYSLKTINATASVYTYTVTPIITQLLEGHLIDSNNIQSDLYEIDLKRQNILNYQLSLTAQARPNLIFVQNDTAVVQTSSTVFLYPVPDKSYTVTLYVKQHLSALTESQTIAEFPFLKALKYQLAKDLSDEYKSVLTPGFYEEYDRLMTEFKAANKRDMTVKNTNPFSGFGRRFRPWGGYAG